MGWFHIALLGAVINALAIVIGGVIGLFLTKIPENLKDTIMKIQGLIIIVLGIQMAVQADDIILLLLALILGSTVGEFIQLELRLNQFGHWMEFKLGDKHAGNLSQGFITGTLIFVVGAMGIIGALDSGIRGNHEVLITKGIMDGFIALVMTTAYGSGVIIAAIPTLLYEGGLSLLATQVDKVVPESILNEMIAQITASGGVIIIAIGLNMLNITKMRVANMIPGIFMAILFVYIYSIF
ncbi:DUF554 domain-containing protein [Abyssicoccus albus]|uniref:Membrane protein YdfK n=1 Tax=Abyssicoccus albus TaxID=1817405 RepID=A0A3N5BMP9_9BACL|nr:hypothetical protein EDD62_0464 [Abyssicoccus albus]